MGKQTGYVSEYIKINGIEQYLLHYRTDPVLPVLLFLHGGPGMAESIFAYTFQEGLSPLFTVVHWDQRGAGKTLTKNKKNISYPTVEELLEDLLEIVRHLKKKYGKEKLVILGHSWGSMLGTLFVQRHPQEVLYYIGAGQFIDVVENEKAGYDKLRELITAAGNQKDLAQLEKIGAYPECNYEKPMIKKIQAIRILQGKYKVGMNFGPILKAIFKSPIFQLSDLSSLFKGMSNNKELWNFMFSSSLYSQSHTYQVPVFYVLGADDFQAPHTIAQRYFETIEAPFKKLLTMKNAAHFMMLDQPQEFANVLSEISRLAHTSNHAGGLKMSTLKIVSAEQVDLPKILDLQYLAYQSEAVLLGNFNIPPLGQTLQELEEEYENGVILKAVYEGGAIVGSVRGYAQSGTLYIGKLIVHPAFQGQGIGTQLLNEIEQLFPQLRYELFTSSRSSKNMRLYERLGFSRFKESRISKDLTFIYLEK